jgi:hypothetical protein
VTVVVSPLIALMKDQHRATPRERRFGGRRSSGIGSTGPASFTRSMDVAGAGVRADLLHPLE